MRSIRDGVLTILEVYDAYQRKGLDSWPAAATVKPLTDAWEAWADELDCSDKHRISLGVSLGYFVGVAPSATINDLPPLTEGRGARSAASIRARSISHDPQHRLAGALGAVV